MTAWPDPWIWDAVADALAAGLGRAAADVEREQAVRGLDARAELELHPLLRDALRAAGFGVAAEVRFPRDRPRPRRTEGARCDMVLTPGGRPLEDPGAQLGLFAAADAVPLTEAAWIEVKVVAQFREGGPNRAYAAALQRPVWGDVEKLAADPDIRLAAALLLLFTADVEVATHDLGVWSAGARQRGLPLAPAVRRDVAIGDRLGNRLCTAAVFPLAR